MKTKPQKHQAEVYNSTRDREYHGYFLEQGLGKTKITLDVAFHLYKEGKIDTLLVFAPNGVHLNWLYSELPKHGWHDVDAVAWRSNMRVKERKALDKIMEPVPRLRMLFANIEAVRTKRGYSAFYKFICSGKCLMVIDESTVIKNPKAQQTKNTLKLANHAEYRRILTGTPMTQGPLDLFSQCRFLHPQALPINSYTAFKHAFAVEKAMTMGNRSFNKVVGYRNLDYLENLLKPFTIRLTKNDCLDLPEKIYQRHYVEMTKDQESVYNSIRDTQVALLEQEQSETGMVSVTSVLAALVKLHQVCCGFVIDDDGQTHDISNARYDTLKYLTSNENKKYVIWTVYRHTVRRIVAELESAYGTGSTVSYYGETGPDDRVRAVHDFQHDDNVRFFVANRAASKGLTLTAASHAIYFASSYSLEDRLQSEDRIHRIGQRSVCLYTDILVPETLEEKILNILQQKKALSDKVITSDWKQLIT